MRLYRLGDPPLDFHPTRQIHSALIARGMYYQQAASVPDWQRQMAQAQWQMEGFIEPQVLERLSAWSYALAGSADLRIPRLYTILAWMGGAVFLLLLARQFSGWTGALAAVLFYLLWPYGVTASRAFQPEPLLLALLLAAVWAALRWQQQPTWRSALAAGVLAGLALYIKVVGVFFIAPVLAVVVLARNQGSLRVALRDPHTWILAALSILPYALYHFFGVYVRGDLAGQFSQRFFPEYWIDPAFYLRWLSNLGRVFPFGLVLVAAAAILLPVQPLHRWILAGWWLGYLLYGLALPHHISTHDYYHVLLFPPIALGVGALAQVVISGWHAPRWLLRASAAAVLLAALLFYGYTARTSIKRSGAPELARMWQEIGALLGPQAQVAALVDDYGVGLKYYAWINPALWQTSADLSFQAAQGDSANWQDWFGDQAAGKEYFVITALEELQRQPELAAFLDQSYPILQQTSAYRIYDLRR